MRRQLLGAFRFQILFKLVKSVVSKSDFDGFKAGKEEYCYARPIIQGLFHLRRVGMGKAYPSVVVAYQTSLPYAYAYASGTNP